MIDWPVSYHIGSRFNNTAAHEKGPQTSLRSLANEAYGPMFNFYSQNAKIRRCRTFHAYQSAKIPVPYQMPLPPRRIS